MFTACGPIVPATTPPQLDYTPGPPVVITENSYDAGPFKVRYPQGWRVITPAAFSTTWVVFTNHTETAVIVLALDFDDTQLVPANLPIDDLQREERTIPLEDNRFLTAVLIAPKQEWAYFYALYEQMINTIY